MKATITKFKLTFIGLSVISVVIGMAITFVLPDKYFNDAIYIVNDPEKKIGWIESYPLTILFYHFTGLKHLHFAIIALIQLPILFYLLSRIGIPTNLHVVNSKNLLFYLVFLMMAIFIGQPTKEFITFPFMFWIVMILTNTKKVFWLQLLKASVLVILFGIFYRSYFIFLPFIALGMYMFTKIKIKNRTFYSIITGILILVFFSISHGLVKGQHFSELSRSAVYEARKNSKDAVTAINTPTDVSTWHGEALNSFYGFYAVNIPLDALVVHYKSPQVLAFVFWQFLLFLILYVRLSKYLRDYSHYKSQLWVILFVFSYFIIQGLFEPDLGTNIRHKIGVFPLIYYAIFHENFNRKT